MKINAGTVITRYNVKAVLIDLEGILEDNGQLLIIMARLSYQAVVK
jgi:hypothetical protein